MIQRRRPGVVDLSDSLPPPPPQRRHRETPPPSPIPHRPGLPGSPRLGSSPPGSPHGSPRVGSPSRRTLQMPYSPPTTYAAAYPTTTSTNPYLSLGIETYDDRGGGELAVRVARARDAVVAGVRDVTRVKRSWGLVWGDPELRSQAVKLTVINLLSLSLLSLFPLVLSPVFAQRDAVRASEVRGWFNVFLSWPLFAICFWVNAIWGPGIAKRAQGMLHPSYRYQPLHTPTTPTVTTTDRVWLTLTRLLLIADFTLVARTLAIVPVVGGILSISFICLINSYYAYDQMPVTMPARMPAPGLAVHQMPSTASALAGLLSCLGTLCSEGGSGTRGYNGNGNGNGMGLPAILGSQLGDQDGHGKWLFQSRQWSLETRSAYVSSRGWYMFGFGLPPTLLTSFGPRLINMAIFSLIYPLLVVQALQSRPPGASLLPGTGTAGSGSSTPTKESQAQLLSSPMLGSTGESPSLRPHVPIFFFARHVLKGVRWLSDAVARERGGGSHERALGRR